MTAEIVTIGDEILIGQIIDTNSAWLAQQLAHAGVRTVQISSLSDSATHIETGVKQALQRAQIVILTGGLGPTKDDITKHTLSSIFSMPLVRDQQSYLHIEEIMRARGIDFNHSNQSQADLPLGCTVLKNSNGTAPGMLFELEDGKLLFSLPGVPYEMKALYLEQVLPLIRSHFTLGENIHRTVVTFGMAESVLSETIAAWEDALPPYLHLAYLPNPRALRLRLSAYEVDNKAEVEKEIELQFNTLRDIIKPYYLGYEPLSVEAALATILQERGATLSVAESCTGGSISARFTAMEGASNYYLGGVTAYDNSVKIAMLGVEAKDLETYGAVSSQVAEQMAIGVRLRTGSDFAIATTGIAGPGGGSDEKPVGSVWIAIAWPDGVRSQLMRFGALREQNIERASTHAINILRLHLLNN